MATSAGGINQSRCTAVINHHNVRNRAMNVCVPDVGGGVGVARVVDVPGDRPLPRRINVLLLALVRAQLERVEVLPALHVQHHYRVQQT